MIRKIVLKKGKIKDLRTCQQKIMPLKKALKKPREKPLTISMCNKN